MQKNPYVILGVDENVSDDQLYEAYRKKRAEYADARFQPGEAGAEAAQKMEELDNAYSDILADRKNRGADGDVTTVFAEVEQMIKDGKLNEAQSRLDGMNQRPAEWHYLQSIVFYRKNWYGESKKQLEMACQQAPGNHKYSDALMRLNNRMNQGQNPQQAKNNASGQQYDPNQRPGQNGQNPNMDPNRQMGGCGTEMNCCANLICADCCCEMMGGDLISCC